MSSTIIIAIDGQAATGKSTLTKNLAEKLGFKYLLTGNLYRAVAKKVINNNLPLNNIDKITEIAQNISYQDLEDNGLNQDDIANIASQIAVLEPVRNALLQLQKDYAQKNYKGIIVEGRDIGTVIFPNANLKLFITASLEARSKRRYKELLNKGITVIYEKVFEDLNNRDMRDNLRAASPLKKAEDAVEIDTSNLDADQTMQVVLNIIEQHCII
jgi:cytidylate kinase